MVCGFFGHRQVLHDVRSHLENLIISLHSKFGVKTFYVGNNGSFDLIVQKTLMRLKVRQRKNFCELQTLAKLLPTV